MPNCIFVYGLLRKKAGHPMALQLKHHAKWIGEGFVFGKIYDIGQYPGVIHDNETKNRVTGDIYAINNLKILDLLDPFEGIDVSLTTPYEYERSETSAYIGNKVYHCWIYYYNWPITSHKKIENGDYLSWINQQ